MQGRFNEPNGPFKKYGINIRVVIREIQNMEQLRRLNQESWFFILASVWMLYLILGTGLHADDYNYVGAQSFSEFLTSPFEGLSLYGLVNYYLLWWTYSVFGYEYQWGYDLVKWTVHIFSTFLAFRFFSLFITPSRAMIAAIVFVLLPLHEVTTYWYMTVGYVLTPALAMISFYFFYTNRYWGGMISGFLGAFSGYISPPYFFGLGLIWFVRREYRKGLLFLLPEIFYVIFYFSMKLLNPASEKKIAHNLDIATFAKSMFLQIGGSIDSYMGPSAFIKLYYSTLSVGLLSLFISIVILVLAVRYLPRGNAGKHNEGTRYLLVGCGAVFLLSLGMYGLTSMYVPSPFGLANRSLIYGSLLVAVLVALVPLNKKSLIVLWLLFVLPVSGLSDYWKAWNKEQQAIIQNIAANQELRKIDKDDLLVVKGHIYNKLGPYSYIEYFSMPWVLQSIFRDFAGIDKVVALTPTVTLQGDELVDEKFGRRLRIGGHVYIYDSQENRVTEGTREDIRRLIEERPPGIRHWVQMTKGTFIERWVVYLSPRLQYLFN